MNGRAPLLQRLRCGGRVPISWRGIGGGKALARRKVGSLSGHCGSWPSWSMHPAMHHLQREIREARPQTPRPRPRLATETLRTRASSNKTEHPGKHDRTNHTRGTNRANKQDKTNKKVHTNFPRIFDTRSLANVFRASPVCGLDTTDLLRRVCPPPHSLTASAVPSVEASCCGRITDTLIAYQRWPDRKRAPAIRVWVGLASQGIAADRSRPQRNLSLDGRY